MASSDGYGFEDILFNVQGRIGIITLNRPRYLNSFSRKLLIELASALRILHEHPTTVFTVITGAGRFFSSGADVRAAANSTIEEDHANPVKKKIDFLSNAETTLAVEIHRSLVDHSKVLVLAMNGPGVGGGATWFQSLADIVFAAESTYLQVPFSALGLVPEYGSATNFAQSIGIRRANDFLMFGRKLTVRELEEWGIVNRVFATEGFLGQVLAFLEQQLDVNDGGSMIEMKRLQNWPLRRERILAIHDATEALAERFVQDVPRQRFLQKSKLMTEKSKTKSKL